MDTPPTPPMAPRPVRGTLVTDDDLVEDDPRRRRMIQIGIAAAAVVALIVLVSVLFALAGKGGGGGDDNPAADTVVIPILAGTLQADAESRLEKLGLVTETSEESSDDVEEGRVIRSEPDAGEEVDKGFSVMLVISTGPDISEVPDVRGQLQVDAVAALEDAGLKVSKVEVDHDPVIEADRATKTDPAAGQELKKGDEVILYVSDGQVQLTDLRNKKSTDAQAELVQLGLVASTQEVETGDFPPGTVIEQSPIPGLVPQGSTVTIKVAKAITTVGVPDVVGKTQANATGLLQGAGFTVTVLNAESPTVPAGKVISQNPAANSQATAGTAVTITVSTGPPDPTPTPAP